MSRLCLSRVSRQYKKGRQRQHGGSASLIGMDIVAFVWSLNGTRRQLSKSQLGMVAARMLEPLKAEAKKRQGHRSDLDENIPPEPVGSYGEAVKQAAALVGVGKTGYTEIPPVFTLLSCLQFMHLRSSFSRIRKHLISV